MNPNITNDEINNRVEIALTKIIDSIKKELKEYEPEYSYKTFEPNREEMRKHFRDFLAKEFPN